MLRVAAREKIKFSLSRRKIDMRKRLLFETNYGISHGRWQNLFLTLMSTASLL
jgi:hypothetical protein